MFGGLTTGLASFYCGTMNSFPFSCYLTTFIFGPTTFASGLFQLL